MPWSAASRRQWRPTDMEASLLHSPILGDLIGRLSSQTSDVIPDESALLALPVLEPLTASKWLLEAPAVSSLSRARLGRFLESLVASIARAREAVPTDVVLAIVRRFGHLLTPAAAQELIARAAVEIPGARVDEGVRAALELAPEHPGLLRAAAEFAIGGGDDARAHDILNRLGRATPDLATMRFVQAARARLSRSEHPTVRIAIASSFTIDPLVAYVDLECRLLRLEPELHVSPFNTWEREMLGEGSALQRFDPQVVFLAAAADDLMPALAASLAHELAAAGADAVDRLLAAAARFTSWSSAMLVVHGLQTAFRDPLGPASGRDGPGRGEVMAQLNTRLAEGLRALPNAYYLDLADVLARRGGGTLDNPKMRHMASMRLGEHVLGDVARSYAHFIAPLKGRTRKCIVVDLDNTLWGGIVGEDGPHGIRLGHASPGSEFREFQQYLLSLSRRGMLLAINSKNNAADALEVIRSHEAMVLREDSFSAMRINWDRKPDNMVSLAQELNIGLDALVFVDDNEKERALMRHALPQVLTPELPRDPARYRETLESLPELQVLTVTNEDRARARQYAERRKREHLRVESQTPEGYLESLGIIAEMDLVSARTLPRVHQLFQRTNQFNLTGRRYELGALGARAAETDWRIYLSQVTDRFGDHGLVAAALVRVGPEGWTIENFVMSCRVIGYGVEDALLARILGDAHGAHARCVVGEVIHTAKNAPAREFYARNEFTRTEDGGEIQRWQRDVSTSGASAPRWIAVRHGNGD